MRLRTLTLLAAVAASPLLAPADGSAQSRDRRPAPRADARDAGSVRRDDRPRRGNNDDRRDDQDDERRRRADDDRYDRRRGDDDRRWNDRGRGERASRGDLVFRDRRGRWITLDDHVIARYHTRGNGPPFCRSGRGHPVHGRSWCLEKGWGLGDAHRVYLDDGRVVVWRGDGTGFLVPNLRLGDGTLWELIAAGALSMLVD